MKRSLYGSLFLVIGLSLSAARLAAQQEPAAGDVIVGTWFTEDSSSKVTIVRNAAGYSGSVSWIKPTDDGKVRLDVKNSDAGLRTRPIMGIDILTGFVYAGNNTWKQGKVYAPRKGNTYSAELTLEADGTLSVKVKAGIGGKTQTWTRA